MNFNYFIPTKILFGPGKLNELVGEKLPEIGRAHV